LPPNTVQALNDREYILNSIQEALQKKSDNPNKRTDLNASPFPPSTDSLLVEFAKNYVATKGHFQYCENTDDLFGYLSALAESKGWEHIFSWEHELQHFLTDRNFLWLRRGKALEDAQASITTCIGLIARTGSIMVDSSRKGGRLLTVFPPVHIVIATTDQVIYDVGDALEMLQNHYGKNMPSMINFITGPSRSGDIEKQLQYGVHGPEELYLFLLEA